MVPRLFSLVTAAILLCCLATLDAPAQGSDVERARAHLDAARTLIPEKPLSIKAAMRTDLAELEVKADRPQITRETSYLLLGILEEKPERPDDYIHGYARLALAQDKTQDALNALERVGKPGMTTQRLYLAATHQLTRRFGLQRGVTLAREAFPKPMERRGVYSKLCYTLAESGKTKTALEFIDISLDLFEIFAKLDAYRYTAVGMHAAGDTPGGIALLDQTLPKVDAYSVPSTRISMYLKLAATYEELGETDRANAMLQRATQTLEQIEPDDYQRDGLLSDVAVGWARAGQRDQAMKRMPQIESKFRLKDVYEAVVEHDLKIGQTARAKALNDEHNLMSAFRFEEAAALAAIRRGDAQDGLARLLKRLDDFASDDWHREAAEALAKQGQHTAIQALLNKTKDSRDRYSLHFGAAQGYLADK